MTKQTFETVSLECKKTELRQEFNAFGVVVFNSFINHR